MDERAPAKINLGLHVRGRRADGYHLLDSLFLPLDLADGVRVALGDGSGVTLRVSGDAARGVPADAGNLAWRAAAGFLERSGLDRSVSIELEKRIPSPAGLGGGSSDAAAVLRALQQLAAQAALPPDALRALALGLGADVPFFLDPRASRITGVGELREDLERAPSLALLLVHPGIPLATADVYRCFDKLSPSLTPAGPDPTLRTLWASGGRLSPSGWAALTHNDLEPAATQLCPPIRTLRNVLADAGAQGVGMSGSGPVVYGVFEDAAQRDEVGAALNVESPARCWRATTIAS